MNLLLIHLGKWIGCNAHWISSGFMWTRQTGLDAHRGVHVNEPLEHGSIYEMTYVITYYIHRLQGTPFDRCGACLQLNRSVSINRNESDKYTTLHLAVISSVQHYYSHEGHSLVLFSFIIDYHLGDEPQTVCCHTSWPYTRWLRWFHQISLVIGINLVSRLYHNIHYSQRAPPWGVGPCNVFIWPVFSLYRLLNYQRRLDSHMTTSYKINYT